MKITTEMMMEKSPCPEYPREKVSAILESGKTLAEILELKKVPAKDRVWAVIQFLPNIENRKFAIWCARRVNRNNVSKITRYIDTVEEFYVFGTLTKKEMDAEYATYNAAYRAADWATYNAAYSAAYCAADSVAYRAAYSVAYYAAGWAADWTAQIEYLKEVAERLSTSQNKVSK